MSCHREQKRKGFQNDKAKIGGRYPHPRAPLLNFKKEFSSRKLSLLETTSASFLPLSRAQATWPAYIFSFLAAMKAPWLVDTWLCQLMNPQQRNTVSLVREGTPFLAPNGIQWIYNGLNGTLLPQNLCPPRTLKCDLIWK